MSEEIDVKEGESSEEEEKRSRELSIRRENPFSLFQQMDRLFDDLSRGFFEDWRPRFPRDFKLADREEPLFRTPLSNIKEAEDHFEISAEMPGLDKGEIEVTFHDDVLEIKGNIEEESEEKEEGETVRREYSSKSYYRAFRLPENIDQDAIDAQLETGVLKVSIPKVEPPKPEKKKIKVK